MILRILAVGDVVGAPGLTFLTERLRAFQEQEHIDFTVVNGENANVVGVTPKLVAGVWVGGEDRSIHLSSGGEGSRIALPIFADFIKRVYNEPKLGITQKDQFPIPVGAVSYDCDESDLHAPASQTRDDEFFD